MEIDLPTCFSYDLSETASKIKSGRELTKFSVFSIKVLGYWIYGKSDGFGIKFMGSFRIEINISWRKFLNQIINSF